MKTDKKYIPIADLDKQEGLSLELFKKINYLKAQSAKDIKITRSKDSYLELLNWVEECFGNDLSDKDGQMLRFVHNKIIIDGEFLQFCKENKVEVKALYKDAIVSWNSDFENEKFFMQGVFVIKHEDTTFIHFALFQKGNQQEDEVSFGILVREKSYEKYLGIRNQFEEWSEKRDRSNLQIRVIDGEDIPYEKNNDWNDVFLPEKLKNNIKQTVEGFLKSKDVYETQGIPWKRGILLFGPAGNGKSTLIKTIMSNYDFKPVTILPSANDDAITAAFAYAEEQSPALLYFEDLDSLLSTINISLFLNLLDGISSKKGLLIIATANKLDHFEPNIKDRPSRFDRKFEIPIPDKQMIDLYIKKWFGKIIVQKDIDRLSDKIAKYEFTYAYIKELYISSVYNAIADDRKQPTTKDVDIAMEQLIDDKFKKNSKKVGVDKYLGKK